MDNIAGRYRLIDQIGVGGMSVVWRGHDDVLGRRVAIKVLAARFAGDPDFRDRLHREAQAVARLTGPGITQVYDYGETSDGTPYLVMELVAGQSLAHHLDRGPLPVPMALDIAGQVAQALAVAHARGLVHRDITPANIMLTGQPGQDGHPAGRIKVVDFGISAIIGEQDDTLAGTPDFLAPEQRAGAPAHAASDIYALGRVLTRALPPDANLPPGISDLITQCLSDDPAVRPGAAVLAEQVANAVPSAATGRAAVPGSAVSGSAVPGPAVSGSAVPGSAGSGATGSGTPPGAGASLAAPGVAAPGGAAPGGMIRPIVGALPPGGATRIAPRSRTGTRVRRASRHRRWPLVLVIILVLLGAFIAGTLVAQRHPWANGARDTPTPAPPTSAQPDSPRPSPSPTPSPTPAMSCLVSYNTTDLRLGFTAKLVITNTSTQRVGGWTLVFDLPPGQRLTFGWGGEWVQNGTQITVRDWLLNGAIAPGDSVTIGFIGRYDGQLGTPNTFTLNDIGCRTSEQ